ncbi:MAG TPA: hypothetical protein VFS39_08420 [Nitrospira sp.]|nr:hypothetical protein [Nitrospira sp.]
MKMLTIICRETLESTIYQVFNDLGVTGYTVMPGLGGKGQTGSVSEYSWMTDRNILFMVALDDGQVAPMTEAIKALYMKLLEQQHGQEVPLKVFLQPCELIL